MTMKKILFFAAAFLFMASAAPALADNDRPIKVEELPADAQQFLRDYFPSSEVSYAKMDAEMIGRDYKVVFTDGSSVEFARDGMWKEVDCKRTEVPAGIVPKAIADEVVRRFPNQKIQDIERDRRGYEVKLDNGIELKYDHKMKLVGIDD